MIHVILHARKMGRESSNMIGRCHMVNIRFSTTNKIHRIDLLSNTSFCMINESWMVGHFHLCLYARNKMKYYQNDSCKNVD